MWGLFYNMKKLFITLIFLLTTTPVFASSYMASLAQVEAAKKFELLVFVKQSCPYCHDEIPELQRINQYFSHKLDIQLIDIQEYPQLAREFFITKTPTLVFLNTKQKEVHREAGLTTADEIAMILEQFNIYPQ